MGSNIMDAAIAQTTISKVGYATPPDGYGAPRTGTVTASVGMAVKKYGRSTAQTTGHVIAINTSVLVSYSSGSARFVQQIMVSGDNYQAFSYGGDSGSLVVVSGGTNDRKVVGLLFAGSGSVSGVNPIGPILTRFGIQINGDTN